ncbi:MAG: HEAT repeat domain-containing protein [Acidobacteria bacterium]|nr:HEAT repeat domain-containing protein [Acidobacteriota bacterium]
MPAAPVVAPFASRDMQQLQDRMETLQRRLEDRWRLRLDDRAVEDLEREMARLSEEALRSDERVRRTLEQEVRRIAEDAQRDATRAADEARRHVADAFGLGGRDDARLIGEQARLVSEQARQMAEYARAQRDFLLRQAPQPPTPSPAPQPRVMAIRSRERDSDDVALYNSGLTLVQQRRYDRAIDQFDRVLAQKSARADGALYWKAFAQARLVRVDDALATLAALRRDHPQSRYLNDARVLEADVRKMTGQRVDPETLDANDEIKLLAINGIANTDPDRAIPLLEGVLNATNTLANKKRALYVLGLNDDPRAHQILLRYAKGAGTPELQLEAVRYLSLRRDGTNRDAELRDVYESTQDPAVRRAIIDAFRAAGDKGFLFAIARDKTVAVDLKRSAITGLATIAPPAELWTLYEQEPDAELRGQIVSAFGSLGATDQLLQIAKTDKDANVRLRALRALGAQNAEKTGTALVDLYGNEQDAAVRRAVMSSLAAQNNAEGLVAIARKETSLDLKREIVRRLSDLAPRNKVAAEYLMEVIK